MLEGMYFENVMKHSRLTPPPMPQINNGNSLGDAAYYRYSLRESTYPTLSLVENITDEEGNSIPAGHYELALSDNHDVFLLLQSKEVIATLPVFKVEIDMSYYEQTRDNKSLRREKKEQKEIEKTNKKRAKVGMPPVDSGQDIYQEASIEYIQSGDYYLIRYERGDVKAWGAIK